MRTLLLLAVVASACTQTSPPAESDWWTHAIETLKQEQRKLYDHKKEKGEDRAWLLSEPSAPADATVIAAAEQRIDMSFDAQFREWLGHVNGWDGFSGADVLYPLADIGPTSEGQRLMHVWIEAAGMTAADLGVESLDDLVAIGGSEGPYYIVTVGSRTNPGRDTAPVFELGGGVIKHNSFREFLQSAVDLAKDRPNSQWW